MPRKGCRGTTTIASPSIPTAHSALVSNILSDSVDRSPSSLDPQARLIVTAAYSSSLSVAPRIRRIPLLLATFDSIYVPYLSPFSLASPYVVPIFKFCFCT